MRTHVLLKAQNDHGLTNRDYLDQILRNLYKDFIVYKDEEIVDIYSRICDHNRGRLCSHNEKIVCPNHGWEFNPEKGGYENIQLVKKKEEYFELINQEELKTILEMYGVDKKQIKTS